MTKRRAGSASKDRTSIPGALDDLRAESEALDTPYALPAEYDNLSEMALKGLIEAQPKRLPTDDRAAVTEEEDPRDKETWSFQFDWTDARGRRYAGKFTNRILSIGLLQRVAAAQAAMQNGQSVEAFSPGMLVVNSAISHMMFSLVERPAWAKDLTAIMSVELIMKLWERVRSHEDYYFRAETASDSGAEGNDDE